jgi:hypothetical protein
MSADLRDPVPTHPPEGPEDNRPYCVDCDEMFTPSAATCPDAPRCESCQDKRNEDAFDHMYDGDSGASTPQTIHEQCDAAWRLKKGLR